MSVVTINEMLLRILTIKISGHSRSVSWFDSRFWSQFSQALAVVILVFASLWFPNLEFQQVSSHPYLPVRILEMNQCKRWAGCVFRHWRDGWRKISDTDTLVVPFVHFVAVAACKGAQRCPRRSTEEMRKRRCRLLPKRLPGQLGQGTSHTEKCG